MLIFKHFYYYLLARNNTTQALNIDFKFWNLKKGNEIILTGGN